MRALRRFKVDPVFKIDETFFKQAESMCTQYRVIHRYHIKTFKGTVKVISSHTPCKGGIARFTIVLLKPLSDQ